MKRKLVLVLGLIVVAAAMIVPASALAGGDQTVSVKFGTKKKNDFPNEFRFYSAKLKPAEFGKPSILAAGPTTFNFKNRGEFPHNFVIVYRTTGGSTDLSLSTPLDPGAKGSISVDLQPGAYVAICTVFNGAHASEGMIIPFTVGTQNGDTGAWE